MGLGLADKVKERTQSKQEMTNQYLLCTIRQNEELLEEIKKLNGYKEQQLDNDVVFREMWQALKASDRRTAYLMVFLACIAFFLDVVQLEDFYIIQQRLALLIEPITRWIGS
jgi:hypothetical protein